MESHKPYIAMLFTQSVYAGMALFSKAAIAKGMNPYVFVVYRQAFASLALAPFAFFLERLFKNSSYFHISVSPLFFLPIYKSYWFFFFFFHFWWICHMCPPIFYRNKAAPLSYYLLFRIFLVSLCGYVTFLFSVSNHKIIFVTRLCMDKFLGSHSV